jgi:hypothetical protein
MFWWFTRRDGEFIRYEAREVSKGAYGYTTGKGQEDEGSKS